VATKSRREGILSGPEERLREHLRERNLRLTPERLLVLHGVLSREGHFDAEDLLEHLRRTHQKG
jgi:Fe2+ or Zn2+ uptake regulation protein